MDAGATTAHRRSLGVGFLSTAFSWQELLHIQTTTTTTVTTTTTTTTNNNNKQQQEPKHQQQQQQQQCRLQSRLGM
jgi:hypothetical protein